MSSQKILLVAAVIVLLVGGYLYVNQSKQLTTTTEITPTEATAMTDGTSEAPVKEFTMTAKKFEFDPAEIRVKQGDKVRLKITSIDVDHGMAIPSLGIDVKLKPNIEEIVEFTADKTGEFEFSCSVFCGEGHRGMKGKIIVE